MRLHAAALAEEALQAYKRGAFEQAIDLFERAHTAYVEEGDILASAETANNLSVALGQVHRFQAALDVLEGTYQIFQDHDEQIKAAQSLGNIAAAYEGLGELEQAEAHYQQASRHFAQLNDPESERFTLQALSRVRLRQGRAIEAVSTMRGALETGTKNTWRNRLVRKILSLPSRILKP